MSKTAVLETNKSTGVVNSRRPLSLRRIAILVVVAIFAYLGITVIQVNQAKTWDHTRSADAAVVLGAAQYDGTPSAALQGRLDTANDLYQSGTVSVVVVTGGAADGDRFSEAYSGLTYLRNKGIPEDDLIVIDDGASTWESMAATSRVLRERGMMDVLLVSDPFHSYRLEGIATEVGLNGYVSPTGAGSTTKQQVRETLIVAVGRIIGYRRLLNLVE